MSISKVGGSGIKTIFSGRGRTITECTSIFYSMQMDTTPIHQEKRVYTQISEFVGLILRNSHNNKLQSVFNLKY